MTSLGTDVFYGCFGLTSITIPNQLGDFIQDHNSLFESGLASINSFISTCAYLSGDTPVTYDYLGIATPACPIACNFTAGPQSCCPATPGSVAIASNATTIPANAFNGCQTLTSIIFANLNSVTSILDNAFSFSSLTAITIPNNVTTLGTSVFFGCSDLTTVIIGSGLTKLPDFTFFVCTALISISIPDTITSLGAQVFVGCTTLSSVHIGSGLTALPDATFGGCSSLITVAIPNSVKSLGTGVFTGCSHLTSVDIGSGITALPDLTFFLCSALTSIEIPTNVTSLGTNVFRGNSELLKITIPNKLGDFIHTHNSLSGSSLERINSIVATCPNLASNTPVTFDSTGTVTPICPTSAPTSTPSKSPTKSPTRKPSKVPTTKAPTKSPVRKPPPPPRPPKLKTIYLRGFDV